MPVRIPMVAEYQRFESQLSMLRVHAAFVGRWEIWKMHVTISLNMSIVEAIRCLGLHWPQFATSAAFDTIVHNILLQRLSTWFGFTDTALLWIQCYLSSRTFSVETSEASSQSCPLTCGVPQGSVLGPLLFILYTTPLSSLIKASSVDHHLYADDTQLFI